MREGGRWWTARCAKLYGPRTDGTRIGVVAARRTVLAPEIDELQVAAAPLVAGEHFLEIALGLFDVLRLRQLPASGEAVDVRIDGERRLAEGLGHDHARGLVSD